MKPGETGSAEAKTKASAIRSASFNWRSENTVGSSPTPSVTIVASAVSSLSVIVSPLGDRRTIIPRATAHIDGPESALLPDLQRTLAHKFQ